MMMTLPYASALAAAIAALSVSAPAAGGGASERYRVVRELQPVGYWPADEGVGEILHERSGNDNHGRLFNTPWRNGLLDFSNNVYQWAQIPHRPEFLSRAFTMGGWVFSRRTHRTSRVLLIGQPLAPSPSGFRWVGWGGRERDDGGALLRFGAAFQDSERVLVGVSSGRKEDVFGTTAERATMATNTWQHLLYVYDEAGAAKLYLNGRLAQSADAVPFKSAETPLVIGADLEQWKVWPPDGRSLDGSVRDLIVFDRALAPEEAERLCQATLPTVRPTPLGHDEIIVGLRSISLGDLPAASTRDRRRALEQLASRGAERLRPMADTLLPILAEALAPWQTRLAATRVLVKLDTDQARGVLRDQALPLLVRTLRDQGLSRAERGEAALALAAMRGGAAGTVSALIEALESILEREGARLPRIEDLTRNALMRALLDIAPQDERVRGMLGRALAEPVFASLDLSKAYLHQARLLVEGGRHMDALDVHRAHLRTVPALPGHRYWGYACPDDVRNALPLREEYANPFFTKGNPFSDAPYRPKGCRPADYTPIAVHKGTTYLTVVERLSQEDVEKQYRNVLQELTAERPATGRKWSRVKVLRIDAGGREQEALLEGGWLIFDARDAKMDGWAIGVDRDGYVHLIGGQHNSPNQGNYIPGSWEKMGLSTDRGQRPRSMYWVSKEPGSITAFDFVGRRGDPRSVPCGWMNYMNFARSPGGTLFLYGRDHIWTWGLYRYDADARRWTGLGGSTTSMLESAKAKTPHWSEHLGATVPYYGPAASRVLVGAWQPGAYNFNRSSWGIRFDRTGRMHVQMGIWGVGENGRMTNGPVYAYSDDLGDTFHRADGVRLRLPLTVNPVPGHHADMRFHSTRQWFSLWVSLMRHAGYSAP